MVIKSIITRTNYFVNRQHAIDFYKKLSRSKNKMSSPAEENPKQAASEVQDDEKKEDDAIAGLLLVLKLLKLLKVFLCLSGAPGTGKSTAACSLADGAGAIVLEEKAEVTSKLLKTGKTFFIYTKNLGTKKMQVLEKMVEKEGYLFINVHLAPGESAEWMAECAKRMNERGPDHLSLSPAHMAFELALKLQCGSILHITKLFMTKENALEPLECPLSEDPVEVVGMFKNGGVGACGFGTADGGHMTSALKKGTQPVACGPVCADAKNQFVDIHELVLRMDLVYIVGPNIYLITPDLWAQMHGKKFEEWRKMFGLKTASVHEPSIAHKEAVLRVQLDATYEGLMEHRDDPVYCSALKKLYDSALEQLAAMIKRMRHLKVGKKGVDMGYFAYVPAAETEFKKLTDVLKVHQHVLEGEGYMCKLPTAVTREAGFDAVLKIARQNGGPPPHLGSLPVKITAHTSREQVVAKICQAVASAVQAKVAAEEAAKVAAQSQMAELAATKAAAQMAELTVAAGGPAAKVAEM